MKPEENDSQQEIIRRKSTKKALNVMKKILQGVRSHSRLPKVTRRACCRGQHRAVLGHSRGQSRALGVRPRRRECTEDADYSTTLPPDTCAQRNRPPVPGFTAVGGGDGPPPGYMQAPSSTNTQRPDATGGGRPGPDHPEASGLGCWMAATKGAGEWGPDGGLGRDAAPGSRAQGGWLDTAEPCPGDGWQGLTGLRSALPSRPRGAGRARKGHSYLRHPRHSDRP